MNPSESINHSVLHSHPGSQHLSASSSHSYHPFLNSLSPLSPPLHSSHLNMHQQQQHHHNDPAAHYPNSMDSTSPNSQISMSSPQYHHLYSPRPHPTHQTSPLHATPPPNRYRHSYPHNSELTATSHASSGSSHIGRPFSTPSPAPSQISMSSSGSSTFSRDIRNIRNQAEKQRRDKLNGYINDLASIVPFITQSKKRQDKTSILRLSAAYIRIQSLLNQSGKRSRSLYGSSPASSTASSFTSSPSVSPENGLLRQHPKLAAIYSALEDALDNLSGFSLITNCHGKILFVTPVIEKFLGHQDNEVIGLTLNSFLHPNDVSAVSNNINVALAQIANGAKESERIVFDCRLKEKNQPRSDSIVYRNVRVSGHITAEFVESNFMPDEIPTQFFHHHHHHAHSHINTNLQQSTVSPQQMSRCNSFSSTTSANIPLHGNSDQTTPLPYSDHSSSLYGDDSPSVSSRSNFHLNQQGQQGSVPNSPREPAYPNEANNSQYYQSQFSPRDIETCMQEAASSKMSLSNLIFFCFVEVIPVNPQNELKLVDAGFDEYISRHALDGTLIYADHRISTVLGYFPSEVMNRSAYDYMVSEDYPIALFAHKLMLSNSNGTGLVVHRVKTVTGEPVFLQTAGCLQYNSAGQIDHFMCVSRLLYEEEGEKERINFVKRFTPHIHNRSPMDLYASLQLVINPFDTAWANFIGNEASSSAASAASTSFPTPTAMAIASSTHQFAKQPARQLPAVFARMAAKQTQESFAQKLKSEPQESFSQELLLDSPSQSVSLQESPSSHPITDVVSHADVSNAMKIFNHMTVQAAIKHLEQNQDVLFSRTTSAHLITGPNKGNSPPGPNKQYDYDAATFLGVSPPILNVTAHQPQLGQTSTSASSNNYFSPSLKRDVDSSFSLPAVPASKKARLASNNTFLRSFSSTSESSHTKPESSKQSKPTSEEESGIKVEEATEIRQSCRYSAGKGSQQGDFTHMLGARVLHYDYAQQASVLSIYTPPEALEAQQQRNMHFSSTNHHQQQTDATKSKTVQSQTSKKSGLKCDCRYPTQEQTRESVIKSQPYHLHHHHTVYSQSSHHFVADNVANACNADNNEQSNFKLDQAKEVVEENASKSAKHISELVSGNISKDSGPYHLHHHHYISGKQASALGKGYSKSTLKDDNDGEEAKDLPTINNITISVPIETNVEYKVIEKATEEDEGSQMVPTSNTLPLSDVLVGSSATSAIIIDDLPDNGEGSEIMLLDEMSNVKAVISDQKGGNDEHHHHHHHHHVHHLHVPVSPNSSNAVLGHVDTNTASAPLSIISTTSSRTSSVDISPIALDGAEGGELIDSSAEMSYSFVPVPVSNKGSPLTPNIVSPQKVQPIDLKRSSTDASPPHLILTKNSSDDNKVPRQKSNTLGQAVKASSPNSSPGTVKKLYQTYSMQNKDDYLPNFVAPNISNNSSSLSTEQNTTKEGTKSKNQNTKSYQGSGFSGNSTKQQHHRQQYARMSQQTLNGDFESTQSPLQISRSLSIESQYLPSEVDYVEDFFSPEMSDLDEVGLMGGLSYARSSSSSMFLHDIDYQRKEEFNLVNFPQFDEADNNAASMLSDLFPLSDNFSAVAAAKNSFVSFLETSKNLDQFNLNALESVTSFSKPTPVISYDQQVKSTIDSRAFSYSTPISNQPVITCSKIKTPTNCEDGQVETTPTTETTITTATKPSTLLDTTNTGIYIYPKSKSSQSFSTSPTSLPLVQPKNVTDKQSNV